MKGANYTRLKTIQQVIKIGPMQELKIYQKNPIPGPPWTALGRRLESLCRKALYDFKLLDEVTSVCVALSGGKDSLTLLFLLHAIRGRGFQNFSLSAVHVGGPFTCGAGVSEKFLSEVCHSLSIPLVIKQSTQKEETLECYSCSRERRKLIFDAAKELGATTVAFGHHRDDSNQTLIMNLLHKGEFAANLPKVPMHDFGVTLIRPLIFISENEIKEFAKLYGFQRITCQCPIGQNSMRKKAEQLICEMEELFPNARNNLFLAGLIHGSKKALCK